MNKTHEYYEKNAQEFFESTVNANLDYLYEDFLEFIPDGGKILDLGCGTGRDSKNFIIKGYDVTSVDASPSLAALAKKELDVNVICKNFVDLNFDCQFHGVWACASLLHCSRAQLPEIIERVVKSLVPGGVFYASFKYGDFEGERDGRFFLDLNEDSVVEVFSKAEEMCIKKVWKTEDVRRERKVNWINIILEKSITQRCTR